MNVLSRFVGFVLMMLGFRRSQGISGARRRWRPAFPVHEHFVQGQLSAGDIYRLLRDRDPIAA